MSTVILNNYKCKHYKVYGYYLIMCLVIKYIIILYWADISTTKCFANGLPSPICWSPDRVPLWIVTSAMKDWVKLDGDWLEEDATFWTKMDARPLLDGTYWVALIRSSRYSDSERIVSHDWLVRKPRWLPISLFPDDGGREDLRNVLLRIPRRCYPI